MCVDVKSAVHGIIMDHIVLYFIILDKLIYQSLQHHGIIQKYNEWGQEREKVTEREKERK